MSKGGVGVRVASSELYGRHVARTEELDALRLTIKRSRLQRLERVLLARSSSVRVLMENWDGLDGGRQAAEMLRTCDLLGLQHVHVVEAYSSFVYAPSTGNNVTVDAPERYLCIHRHESLHDALAALPRGCVFVAVSGASASAGCCGAAASCWTDVDSESDLYESCSAVQGADDAGRHSRDQCASCTVQNTLSLFEDAWQSKLQELGPGAKVCILVGNQMRGLSRLLQSVASATVYVPPLGLSSAFTLVQTASMLIESLRAAGVLQPDLVREEPALVAFLYATWILRLSVTAPRMIERNGWEATFDWY
mmetsp:Transcript_996/g.2846  ORF Transcript_996/g.2846 Transcript_996/m.2846 type:complete len:308 (-) Transcript_996:1759-2682(-)